MNGTQLQISPHVGEVAPDSSAASTSGRVVSLSSFPRREEFTAGLFPARFHRNLHEGAGQLHGRFRSVRGEGSRYPSNLCRLDSITPRIQEQASDENGAGQRLKRYISRAYGVLNEDKFYSNRAYFLIDVDGNIRWSRTESNNGERRGNSEILAAIKLLS